MKPIKDVKFHVDIFYLSSSDKYFWRADFIESKECQRSITGLCSPISLESAKCFQTRYSAIRNWKRFAKINGIKNYKIAKAA